MECKYCKETYESQLLESSTLLSGRLDTVIICFRCFWDGKHKTVIENGNLLSDKEPIECSASAKCNYTSNLQERS